MKFVELEKNNHIISINPAKIELIEDCSYKNSGCCRIYLRFDGKHFSPSGDYIEIDIPYRDLMDKINKALE